MLRGLLTSIKYFTLGLLVGLLFAPRKGSETAKLLIGRGKEFVEENLDITEQSSRDNEE